MHSDSIIPVRFIYIYIYTLFIQLFFCKYIVKAGPQLKAAILSLAWRRGSMLEKIQDDFVLLV